jgi:hypothetical protein
MNLTRRLFSALIPAAPAGAMVARSGLGSSYPPPPPSVMPDSGLMPGLRAGNMLNKVVREVAPPTFKKYQEAQELASQMHHFRYMLRDRMDDRQCTMDPDIAALKSVPLRHKAHMQLKKEDDERKQEQSFMSALAESLGLKEYLEKRNSLDQYGDANEKVAVESSRW